MVNKSKYTGYKEILMNESEMAEFYSNLDINKYDCLVNEYIIVCSIDGEPVDYYRWSGEQFVHVTSKTINSSFSGKIKSKNVQQSLAIDLLYQNDITVKVLSGCFGSGKDLLMSSVALDLIKRNTVEKIVWIRNNIAVKDTKDIGALPGSQNDKLLPFVMPLADHVGGVSGLEYLMSQGKIEVLPLGFARGRDIKNSIIICSESENMTKQHIQLLLGRVGEGSSLWLNGDYRQTDAKVFEDNNGLLAAVEKLKGHQRFGYVHLIKTERSETAALADLLD